MAADEMVGAIRGNDVARLTRIPGIGKKTAERMVLELRDKLPEAGPTSTPAVPSHERHRRRRALGIAESRVSARRRRESSRGSYEERQANVRRPFREAIGSLSK